MWVPNGTNHPPTEHTGTPPLTCQHAHVYMKSWETYEVVIDFLSDWLVRLCLLGLVKDIQGILKGPATTEHKEESL